MGERGDRSTEPQKHATGAEMETRAPEPQHEANDPVDEAGNRPAELDSVGEVFNDALSAPVPSWGSPPGRRAAVALAQDRAEERQDREGVRQDRA